ncbi:MAG: hypothetical protein AAFQ36_10525 [Pseudomonadota bacterium]
MSDTLNDLFQVDRLAKQFGSGLNPKLRALLEERGAAAAQPDGAVPLHTRQHSAGPRQFVTAQQVLEDPKLVAFPGTDLSRQIGLIRSSKRA